MLTGRQENTKLFQLTFFSVLVKKLYREYIKMIATVKALYKVKSENIQDHFPTNDK